MAKDPAFLFYPGDWLSGTIGMTFEEKGAYMEVLMMQFNRGHMTEHMIRHVVGQIWDKIQEKFTKDTSGLWYNKRLEEEKDKRKAFTDSRKNNVLGTNQYTKKNGHMASHMENENKYKKGSMRENKMVGKSFSTDNSEVVFEDGSSQKLGESQLMEIERGSLSPQSVVKGHKY